MKPEKSALLPNNHDSLPREAKKTTDSTIDRIYKYYHNRKSRVELTPEEDKIRNRIEKAWYLMSARHRTNKSVVDVLTRLFGIEKSVAYDDVRNAQLLFGSPELQIKDAKRAIAETMAMQGADKAWKKGDMDAYAKFVKMYCDINNLNGDEGDGLAEALKKLKPQQVVIVADTGILEKQAEALRDELTQDIEYKDAE